MNRVKVAKELLRIAELLCARVTSDQDVERTLKALIVNLSKEGDSWSSQGVGYLQQVLSYVKGKPSKVRSAGDAARALITAENYISNPRYVRPLTDVLGYFVALDKRVASAGNKIALKFVLNRQYGTNDRDVEMIAKGSLPQLNNWAKKRRLKWIKNSNIFGGYWVDTGNGDAYLFDVEV